jgi:hypothetical protein
MLQKISTDVKMFDPSTIVVLSHQEIKIPCGRYGFNLITKLLVAQNFITIQ